VTGLRREDEVGGSVGGASEQVQPAPVISAGVIPAGSWSVTVTGPDVAPAPGALDTVSV